MLGLFQYASYLQANKYGQTSEIFNLHVLQPPNAPKNLVVKEISSRSAIVFWNSENSQPINGFIVQYKSKTGMWNEVDRKLMDGDAHSVQVNHLKPAHEYNVRIFAKNLMGEGMPSEVMSFKTEAEVPSGPPQDLHLRAVSSNEFLLTWSPPEKELWNGEILGYSIGFKKTNEPVDQYKFIKTGRSFNEYRLRDLEEFTDYDVVMKCFNEKGESAASMTVSARTKEGIPKHQPQKITCSGITSSAIAIEWKEVSSRNGIIRGYRVHFEMADSQSSDFSVREMKTATTPSIVIHGLIPFTNYSIEIAGWYNFHYLKEK